MANQLTPAGFTRLRAVNDDGTLGFEFVKYLQGLEIAAVSLSQYPVASLPVKGIPEGRTAYATDGRKIGEGPGAGTGVPCYLSHGTWRRLSDDTQVAA